MRSFEENREFDLLVKVLKIFEKDEFNLELRIKDTSNELWFITIPKLKYGSIKEGEIIRQYKDQCVNKRIEGRTSKEWSQDDYKNNKEKYQIKAKIRYENKKDLIIEQQLNYYNNNKEIILSKQKEYINNNKETIEEKGKEKITCECGAIISKWGLTNHKKTLAHLSIV